ncbi:unnamed protein product [Didymodactylos carnosus]|uniref:Uncharacterized protein n=1 Tax=Didymodactylos carnosus TaxID=1234261 RepID=A0A8S2D7U0_9BILA|nr:unnamed protein product [Didymodactylos carnosus]CAF3611953.1 unnamed protein product [Didymodactylos carnosus]
MDHYEEDSLRTYKGSHIFKYFSKFTGLPLDQFNFILAQTLALIIAICFRRYLPPKPENVLKRHLLGALIGIAIGQFCFGQQIWHLIVQSCVSYLMLFMLKPKYSYLVVFVFCILYLSFIHIHRLIFDYGNYTLDISGPLMINTQKLTALAFAFYDGHRSTKRKTQDNIEETVLNDDQKRHMIKNIPHPIEFLSYIFYFHGICVGPLCFYKDFIDYIEGRNILILPTNQDIVRDANSASSTNDDQQLTSSYRSLPIEQRQPSTLWPVSTKILQALFWAFILMKFSPHNPVDYNISNKMVNSPFLKRVQYLWFSSFCSRAKYYFAWIYGEAINNAAGLGLNGYDEKTKQPKWNLLTNIIPYKLELATSIKVTFDVWNMQTALWLRRICYDRLKKGRTLFVFILSAFWHGFYPGYYFTFVLAALGTYAGRGIRREIRPYFQKDPVTKVIYSILTWIGTHILQEFIVIPFVLLEVQKCVYFYRTWYFIVPIVVILIPILLPGASTKTSRPNDLKNQSTKNNNQKQSSQEIEKQKEL